MSLAGLAACMAHGCTGESTTGLALPDLAAHQWKHRVLIVDTPSVQAAPYLQQISALDAAAAGLKERDLEVIIQTSAPAFRVRLVGKDGGVKLDRSPDPIRPQKPVCRGSGPISGNSLELMIRHGGLLRLSR